MRKPFVWLIVLPVLCLFPAPKAVAVDFFGVDVSGIEVGSAVLAIRNSVGDSAPEPIVNTLGLSVPFKFQNGLYYRQEISVFFQGYGYQNGRAIPLESMFDSVIMMAINVNPSFGVDFPLMNDTTFGRLTAGAEGGLALITRWPIFFLGKGGADYAIPVSGWFWTGRFLYPNASASLTWQLWSDYALVFRLTGYYPVYNLWTATEWWDNTMLGLNIGLKFTF